MTITTDNYESWFYRYSEGELDEREQREVEAFAAQHPALAEELNLYDPELKLQAAPMVFADKESLMKHERKVVPLWRWAVAACVAAAMVAGVWLYTFEREAESPMVAQTSVQQPIPMQPTATATPTQAPAQTSAPAITNRPPARPRPLKHIQPVTPHATVATEPTVTVAPAIAAEPITENTTAETMAESQPTVIIHHEVYVVASIEPDTFEESTVEAEPPSGIEGLRALGRSIGVRLRAEALRAQGNAKIMLASL